MKIFYLLLILSCTIFFISPARQLDETIDDSAFMAALTPSDRPCIASGPCNESCIDGTLTPRTFSCSTIRPEHICYSTAVCERHPNGKCGWRSTPEFNFCLEKWRGYISTNTTALPTDESEILPSHEIEPAATACRIERCTDCLETNLPEEVDIRSSETCMSHPISVCYFLFGRCIKLNTGRCGWALNTELANCLVR